MYTRHIATTHRNDASHSGTQALPVLAGRIHRHRHRPLQNRTMALLAQMQPGRASESWPSSFRDYRSNGIRSKQTGAGTSPPHPATGLNLSIAMGPVPGATLLLLVVSNNLRPPPGPGREPWI